MASNLSNLTRGTLVRNKNCGNSGLKHYLRLLQKYNIAPTVDGPYCSVNKVHQTGSQAIMKKFGQKVGGRAHLQGHSLAKKDPSTGQTGEVPAADTEQNALYLATVGIGSPAQTMDLDFDTGSADLWVWSTKLPSATIKQYGSQHHIFDPTKSSTWEDKSDSSWKIAYGDGSQASGSVGNDNLTVGGLVVEGQAIELASTLSDSFETGEGDGLLGLAWGSINTVTPTPVATPVENMITQQDIKSSSELFTAFLGNTNEDSFYTFGYIDQDALAGQTPAYTPVDNSQGFWMFDSASTTVNGQTVSQPGNTAIADTGTTLALVSDKVCEAIYGAIPGAKQNQQQQGWVIPNSVSDADLPAVAFAVGEKLFTIKPADLKFQDLQDGTSYGGIQSRGQQGFDILGDVFLRGVYAIFDQGQQRFGCTSRVDSSASSGAGAGSSGTGAGAGGSGSV